MPAEQFYLRWDNHHPNLISEFSTLQKFDQMVDVTLICDNREIHAHKIVLSACSPFFQSIFIRNSCKHPVIVLTDIKYIHLKSLIDFIYNGEVNVFQEDLAELLRIANVLKVKGLNEVSASANHNVLSNAERLQTQDDFSASNGSRISSSNPAFDPIDLPSTSDQKVKKRKSVSFSDTPEIVYSQSSSNSTPTTQNDCSRKRKLRSSSDICSIVKIEPEANSSNNYEVQYEGTESIANVNPLGYFSSTDSTTTDNESKSPAIGPLATAQPTLTEAAPIKKRVDTNRKMIRKNENFLRALEAVRTEGIGFCKAAKLYGVNNRTLWLEYQKLGYPMKNARRKAQN